ncbi:ATP-binding protein [Sphaerisporangium rhizosphaerae]|uniref:ATP-binding protein n=1 Tax=Sphaerisporangium rhizosphaerae TaxID=2269375 RepID=A0ABW2NXF5_9ACTN
MMVTPGGLRAVCWDVPCDVAVVGEVRSGVRDTCRVWAVPEEVADDVVLVVGELLGNAVVHGRPPVRLSLWENERGLCVRVTDHGPDGPRRLHLSPEAVHGRGLAIVEALADRWGVIHAADETGTGKTVWAAWHRARTTPGVPCTQDVDQASTSGG